LEESEKKFDAIYCGSVSESKGIFLMLNALVAAKRKGYIFRLAIVGAFSRPDLQLEINKKIAKENLTDQVFFSGEVSLEEVKFYYLRSKVAFCLFPKNRTNQLILPIKLFEYAAFGLPVVGSNFGHIARIILSDKIGVCVNPHDTEAVASAWIALIGNDKYKEYIPLCVHCIKNKYLWENQKANLLRVYEELLNL
jgi:glycosyltransferase involved in cell wall biosynthesis